MQEANFEAVYPMSLHTTDNSVYIHIVVRVHSDLATSHPPGSVFSVSMQRPGTQS